MIWTYAGVETAQFLFEGEFCGYKFRILNKNTACFSGNSENLLIPETCLSERVYNEGGLSTEAVNYKCSRALAFILELLVLYLKSTQLFDRTSQKLMHVQIKSPGLSSDPNPEPVTLTWIVTKCPGSELGGLAPLQTFPGCSS